MHMYLYVSHWDPKSGDRCPLGTLNNAIWHDLKTWKGVKSRCRRLYPGQHCRVEQVGYLDPIDVRRHTIRVVEFDCPPWAP